MIDLEPRTYPGHRRHVLIYLAFTLSGVAGLVYEVVWSRYLAIFVGHGAYAQVLVLAVYLGGMAVGAMAVSGVSRRLRRPLIGYAGAEATLGVLALVFHLVFLLATRFAYDTVFPALGSASLSGAARWGLAGLLVLPSAVVLGTTFPLMAAGLVRRDPGRPGRAVANAYLANTVGGAAGVLVAGFGLIPSIGLPGTVLVAGALNAAAAMLVVVAERGAPALEAAPVVGPRGASDPPEVEGGARGRGGLWPLLLGVSFGTALASFAYEIGWIRLLAMALGSASHSFDLMLSAFILGLAIGARLVRGPSDRAQDPVRVLGWVQWAMGAAALATLPFYASAFEAVGRLVTVLEQRDGGYALFNLARYGVALAMMLPATILAGATLPLITAALLRAGVGERSIGRVYGYNTLGSVSGAFLAGLVALPILGLKGLLVAGALVDMALGVMLLGLGGSRAGRRPVLGLWMAAATASVAMVVGRLVVLDPLVLASGVYRYGRLPTEGSRRILYYRDGRTASVSVHLQTQEGLVVLATNGKPDASLDSRWFNPRRDTVPPTPIPESQDAPVQVLGPLVGLAHHPSARTAVNIGHGSGMSGHALLSSPALERMVTVEIEPAMVEGSLSFMPANRRVFEDPRATFVFDDAKSFLAYGNERFDLIFSEPSNPWVTGVSALFTVEFYQRITRYMAPGGVFSQWIHLYEIDDDLVLSVVQALDSVFPSYKAYHLGDNDIVFVASADRLLPEADWTILDWPGVREMLVDVPPVRRQHMESLEVLDEALLRPVLDDRGVRPNSDYHPILESGAERARFEDRWAEGFYSFGANRIDLRRTLARTRMEPPDTFEAVPARGLAPAVQRGQSTWLHEALERGGAVAPPGFPEWGTALVDLQDFLDDMRPGRPPVSWLTWSQRFDRVERDLHFGTSGWIDTTLYAATSRFLDATDAPPEARASVALLHGIGSWTFDEAASAADVLVPAQEGGVTWVRSTVLLDAAVLAYLETGRAREARAAFDRLAPLSGRRPWNVRNRLLDALVRAAEVAAQAASGDNGLPQ